MLKFSFLALTALVCSGVSAQSPDASIKSAASPLLLPKCLQVRNANFNDGTPVEMFDCNNSPSQIWEIFSGLTEIKLADPNQNTRFCIDAIDVDAGNQVVIRECNYDAPQQWIFTDDAQLTLANNTNLCLEVPNSSTENGVQVQTSNCNGQLNQMWELV